MWRVIAAVAISLTGCQDQRVTDLEKRVSGLEQSVRQLESDSQVRATKAAGDDEDRREKLRACVADANAAFEQSVRSNGTKLGNGSYDVGVPLLEQMQKQKQSKIEECRLLYSK
jgi:outer membrane murein-binding lipoprotein Lpp